MHTTLRASGAQASKKSDAIKEVSHAKAAANEALAVLRKQRVTTEGLWNDLEDAVACSVSRALREHMEMAALGEAGLFAAMQSGPGNAAAEEEGQVMLAEEGYLAFLRNLKMSESDEMLQKVFAKVGTAGKLSEA